MSDLHGLVEHKYITQKSLKTILKISMITRFFILLMNMGCCNNVHGDNHQ